MASPSAPGRRRHNKQLNFKMECNVDDVIVCIGGWWSTSGDCVADGIIWLGFDWVCVCVKGDGRREWVFSLLSYVRIHWRLLWISVKLLAWEIQDHIFSSELYDPISNVSVMLSHCLRNCGTPNHQAVFDSCKSEYRPFLCIGRYFLGVKYLCDVLLGKVNPQKLRSAIADR